MRLFLQFARSAVAWSLAANGLRVAGALLVLPLIVRTIPSAELGLWYVFVSIVSLAGILDLGFGPTLTQATGYAWAGAKKLQELGIAHKEPGEVAGEPNYGLLAALVGTMRRYYQVLATIVIVLLLTLGSWWIWDKTVDMSQSGPLRLAWVVFSFGAALNVLGSLWPAVLSGINGVRQAQQLFTLSIVVNYLTLAIGLVFHCGIWSLVAGQVVLGLIQRQGGKLYFRNLAGEAFNESAVTVDRQIIGVLWPMAWRNGVLALGTFLIQSANTLICSAKLGLDSTASYGLTLQIINLLMAVSMTWVLVKLPLINQLRTARDLERVTALFVARLRIAILTFVLGAFAILLLGNTMLHLLGAKTLLLPTAQLAVILFIYFLEMNHSCHAALVISENVNPFVLPALLSGSAVVLLSLLLTPIWAIWGIIASFGIVQIAFNNWWPVLRAIRGLGLRPKAYWQIFLGIRQPQS